MRVLRAFSHILDMSLEHHHLGDAPSFGRLLKVRSFLFLLHIICIHVQTYKSYI